MSRNAKQSSFSATLYEGISPAMMREKMDAIRGGINKYMCSVAPGSEADIEDFKFHESLGNFDFYHVAFLVAEQALGDGG